MRICLVRVILLIGDKVEFVVSLFFLIFYVVISVLDSVVCVLVEIRSSRECFIIESCSSI